METTTGNARDSAQLAWLKLGPGLREELPPPFPADEYADRWRRVQAEMEASRISMIYVSDPADLCYLTGYQLAWYQDSGPQEWVAATGLALNADHDTPIFFDTADERLIGTAMSHAPDYRVYHAPGGVAADPDLKGFDWLTGFIADSLKAEGWLSGVVGLQRWSYRPARAYSEVFQAALEAGGARVTDASWLVAKVRQRKSERELACVRAAARIADIGMHGAVAAIAEGATELEVWAAMTAAMAGHGGELSAIPGMVNSGPKCASLHGLASRRKLRRGDLVNIDMCGVMNRYHSNLARTISLGEPAPEVRAAMEKVPEHFRTVTAEYRPGMSYREILQINESVARKLGIWHDRWWVGGYDLGIAFPPDWVGVSYFSGGEDPGEHVLEPGMVMNHEFNFYLPDGSGIRELIDTMIVTADEVQFLHTFPVDLTVVE